MAFVSRSQCLSVISGLFLALLVVLLAASLVQADPRVLLRVPDTSVTPGATDVPISVYMDNYLDDVTAVYFSLRFGQNDIMEFQIDTLEEILHTYFQCTDPSDYEVGMDCNHWIQVDASEPYDSVFTETIDVVAVNYEITDCLIETWEYMRIQSSSGTNQDVEVYAFADDFGPPIIPGIQAGQQGGVLIKMLADVYDLPDSIEDRNVNIEIKNEFYDQVIISDGNGDAIGIKYNVEYDTNYYYCLQWAGDSCLNWEKVPEYEEWDWFDVDTLNIPYLDTTEVILMNGELTVDLHPQSCCIGIRGNANNDAGEAINISDVTYLVAYCFGGGPAPVCPEEGNANADAGGAINISDITYLVAYCFGGGPAPAACPN